MSQRDMVATGATSFVGVAGADGLAQAGPARDEVVRVSGVSRTFGRGEHAVHAVQDVSFSARRGELVAIRGRSGAGKTTLLNLIGGLDRPDSGQVVVAGHEVTAAGEAELLRLRRGTVGFVFQTFGLVPILSAAENVGVPLRLAQVPAAERSSGSRFCWSWSAWVGTRASARTSSPAGSSSGSRWPVRWPTSRICSSPTNPPASSTPRRVGRSWTCCARWCTPVA
ncbi:hypothetical protein GCM10027614_69280 [Micromonospora vulcania]